MSRAGLTTAGVALCAAMLAGCEDVPFVPRWDADWYLPLPSEAVFLSSGYPVGVPIPPGTSANISFPPQSQDLDESVGQILEQVNGATSVILTLTKPAALQFAASDTLFIAATAGELAGAPNPNRIDIPITIAATDAAVVDTVTITTGGVNMLRNAATNGSSIFIQLRGRATYQGATPYTVQPTDSIAVRLALLARIGVSTN